MESVTIKGMNFIPYIKREEIAKQVKRVADEIRRDFEGSEPPLFICVLNGAFVFAADLFRACCMPESEITFMRYKSYEGTSSTGVVNELLGLQIASIHNLAFYLWLVREARRHIQDDTFSGWKSQMVSQLARKL